MKNSEYVPARLIWLLFDTDNGHAPHKRYTWWFDTKKDALAHKRWQKKQPNSARLSGPYPFKPAKN